MDEPPCRKTNPAMELLLMCLSLWILQCNSARADSIIHIGKARLLHYHQAARSVRCATLRFDCKGFDERAGGSGVGSQPDLCKTLTGERVEKLRFFVAIFSPVSDLI